VLDAGPCTFGENKLRASICMTGHLIPGQDDVVPFDRGLPQRSQTCASGRKLVGHDVCIESDLAHGMVFVKFSFIDNVLLTDKPKSVASGAVSMAVDEAELQEDSSCWSGNFNI